MKDYYEILGISSSSETEVVSAAYKAMMRKYHPDTSRYVKAAERAMEINEAYEVLKNPLLRKDYDLKRMSGNSKASPPPPTTPPPAPTAESAKEPDKNRIRNIDRIVLGFVFAICLLAIMENLEIDDSVLVASETFAPNSSGDIYLSEDNSNFETSDFGEAGNSTEVTALPPVAPPPNNSIAQMIPDASRRTHDIDMSAVTLTEKRSMESACSTERVLEGAASYNRCLQGQLTRLASSPRSPDMSGVTPDERRSMESACSTQRVLEGAARYNSCLQDQMRQLGF